MQRRAVNAGARQGRVCKAAGIKGVGGSGACNTAALTAWRPLDQGARPTRMPPQRPGAPAAAAWPAAAEAAAAPRIHMPNPMHGAQSPRNEPLRCRCSRPTPRGAGTCGHALPQRSMALIHTAGSGGHQERELRPAPPCCRSNGDGALGTGNCMYSFVWTQLNTSRVQFVRGRQTPGAWCPARAPMQSPATWPWLYRMPPPPCISASPMY